MSTKNDRSRSPGDDPSRAVWQKWLIVIGIVLVLLIIFMLPLRLHIPYPAK